MDGNDNSKGNGDRGGGDGDKDNSGDTHTTINSINGKERQNIIHPSIVDNR
jgi:hypothetical protein